MCSSILILAVLLADPPVRQSADGIPFPPAVDRKVDIELPNARRMLGMLPEEVSRRLRGRQSAEKAMRDRGLEVVGDFVDFGVAGADAVGITLADGRVRKIDLAYKSLSKERAAELRRRLEKIDGDPDWAQFQIKGVVVQATVVASGERVDPRTGPAVGHVVYEVPPQEWYVLHHPLPPDIAAAMRGLRIVRGMTFEEAKIVLGEPVGDTDSDGRKSYTWIQREGTPPTGTGRITRAVRASVGADGKIESVTDDRS